jgi:hypothetical protein
MKAAIASAIETGKTLPAHRNFPQIELEAKAEFDKLWKPSTDTKAVMDAVAAIAKKNLR